MTRRGLGVLAVALGSLVACHRAEKRMAETTTDLQQVIEAPKPPPFVDSGASGARIWKAEQAFYRHRHYAPAWMENGRPNAAAQELVAAVNDATLEGLNPADYNLGSVATPAEASARAQGLEPPAAAEADLRLSHAFLEYASDLMAGRVDPTQVDPHWFGQTRQAPLPDLLAKATETHQVRATLRGLLPQHPQYAALQQALQRYRDIAAHGGWPVEFSGRTGLGKGARGPAVAALRARLLAGGDLPAGPATQNASQSAGDVFDDTVVTALKRFQRRHGLLDDGRLSPAVAAALAVPVEVRIRQIELNLERWRWLPETLGDRHIIVNIPSFQLVAYEGGQPALAMRVVTGEKDKPTPIFSDRLTEIVFSPYWRIPPKIAQEEIIPAILRNPDYLARNNLEVVKSGRVLDPWHVDWNDPNPDFQIRQRPGAKNSLGFVKFNFPNKFDVYLHDTPADSLFSRVERDLSHGCVRVEKPTELAQWVLEYQPEWTRERIEAAMHSGDEQHVAVKRPVPVYLLYQTAWAEPDGAVEFREDVYGHDASQLKLLPPSPPPARLAQAGALQAS